MNTNDENELEVVEELEGLPVHASYVGALDKAQIDVQIATAKRYPRSIEKAIKDAIVLATTDEKIATGMFYVLPRKDRDGKKIEGPSVRLAEVMTYSWQNLRAEADVIGTDDKYVTAMGTCFDLERNIAVRVRVKRRIVDKEGRRYNDDMIQMTSNAAISIALRNAVFKVIPLALTKRVYDQAKKASAGPAHTFAEKRKNAIDWFEKQGLKRAQLFELLEIAGADDIGADQIIELNGLRTALEDGETTVAQLLAKGTAQSEGADELNAAVKGNKSNPTTGGTAGDGSISGERSLNL